MLEEIIKNGIELEEMPYCLRVLTFNVFSKLGQEEAQGIINTLKEWEKWQGKVEIPVYPTRVILQDFTGVPAIADIAMMRSKAIDHGIHPSQINPLIPVHLVIDHSIQVDFWGNKDAFRKNMELEFKRNYERYRFLKWGQNAIKNMKIIPPGMGIVHQVNIEYLAQVVIQNGEEGFPELIIGTDSHTTMINGIGVVGWGVGGIEAEGAMLGFPMYILFPEVIGVYIHGKLKGHATATDIALTFANMLRKEGVVDKFVEVYGPGLKEMSAVDRTTIANMSPEYGCTITYFPIDERTLEYLELTGRSKHHIEFVEKWCRENLLFMDETKADKIKYTKVIELDLSKINTIMSGPARPHDTVSLDAVPDSAVKYIQKHNPDIQIKREEDTLTHGSIVIAAITSCTNTSNPYVLVSAGLVAKKLCEYGLKPKDWVKTSFAPGSGVVEQYLKKSGLLQYLEQIGFHLVGRGCTTCIGNSGPLPQNIENTIKEKGLYVCSVLSGNRNFEGRIHPLVKLNYLASPPLVVAYSVAGNILKNLEKEPLGYSNGKAVFLKDVLPQPHEVWNIISTVLSRDDFINFYSDVYKGEELWQQIQAPSGELYEWDNNSTYIKCPPFLDEDYSFEWGKDIEGARCLLLLGDSITTDHISPAGSIHPDSPAGIYLQQMGIRPPDFNTYGARRGNHEIMIRGTFANVRLKNLLVKGKEGWFTLLFPEKQETTVFEAAVEYRRRKTPLIVIAGKEYGSGSSRDWAAKGTYLLGISCLLYTSDAADE